MSEEQYYTPDITVFHVGFECEIHSSIADKFCRTPMMEWNPMVIHQTDILFSIAWALDKFRVKKLDSSDITSLGWYETHRNYYLMQAPGSMAVWTQVVLDARFAGRDGAISIRGKRCDEYADLFVGTLRNKSELQQVMKMIGINTQV